MSHSDLAALFAATDKALADEKAALEGRASYIGGVLSARQPRQADPAPQASAVAKA